ncbi:hypothetical protein EXS72_00985 [Candidatus Pacearchaeota archaeon]|nr:hypothetical protein [Candidatus Pacearchaeota archaeon]
MNSKVFLFGVVFLILVIGVFMYLNKSNLESQNAPPSEKNECKSLIYSGEDRIDLLFISSKEEAQRYINLFFETEPFKEHESYFNVYFIDDANPICESYKGIAILCNTNEVQSLAKNCPHDYIVVVKDEPVEIRSSAYGNVMSLNKNVEASVFIHEFGHAFANLAEEYAPAKVPRSAKNCQSSCEKFGELADSCSKECSESGLYRSIQSGVMRTLITANFGRYNVELIKKLLQKNKPSELAITGNQIQENSLCDAQKLTKIKITQKDNFIDAESTNELIFGCTPDKSGEGETCIGERCYHLEDVFTDFPKDELLSGGELPALETTTFLVSTSLGEIPITQNNNLVAIINTAQAGAIACKIN